MREPRARRRRTRSRRSAHSELTQRTPPGPQPRTSVPVTGQVIAGKYRIDQPLGHGGMGAVYAATHLVSEKRVALKWMLPAIDNVEGASERFVREARATARIDHPNVVDIYDVGVEHGSVYLVMELLHGESLSDRLDRAPVGPTEAVGLLMPAMRAVAAAHAQGVIHRDLKPDNIFLCQGPDGEPREPKVLDFGISKIAAEERGDLSLTQSGTVMGTPYYMSPEQVRGLKDVDARGDVYAFGVILYEMLADCFPFDAETYNQLILKIATADPVPIPELNPEVDPALATVVAKAMARETEDRYQSVAELAADLERFAGGVTFRPQISIPGEPAPTDASMRVRRPAEDTTPSTHPPKRTRWGAVAAAVVIATAILAWALLHREAVPETATGTGTETATGTETETATGTETATETVPVPVPETATGTETATETATGTAPETETGTEAETAAAATKNPRSPRRAGRPGARPAVVEAASETEVGRTLAPNWDEQLPTTTGERPKSPPPGKSAAGKLSLDDL